jgi:hypothetical protein
VIGTIFKVEAHATNAVRDRTGFPSIHTATFPDAMSEVVIVANPPRSRRIMFFSEGAAKFFNQAVHHRLRCAP